MNCCRGKRDAQTESGSKRDEESAKSLEEDEEEVDPDALKTWQVRCLFYTLLPSDATIR